MKDVKAGSAGSKRSPAALTRRGFLGGVSVAAISSSTALRAVSAVAPTAALPAGDRADNLAMDRSRRAFAIRRDAALFHRSLPALAHPANGDEDRYARHLGSYSKGLPHNRFGEVDPVAYAALLGALASGGPDDFEAIPLGGGRKLVNPQAGFAFDLEGADAQYLTIPAAPALASAETAGEAVELYWMALLRDVDFLDFAGHPDVEAALADLNALSDFRGPRQGGRVIAQTLFRDRLPGVRRGPYVSQFLWRPAPFGAEHVDRRMRIPLAGSDHLTRYGEWLEAQNGVPPAGGVIHDSVRRYIRNGRDLAEWVHIDVLFQAYFNACLILGTPSDPTDEVTGGGIGCPLNPGNPYRDSRTQEGFATFGGPHFKTLLCEVATRALKATWFQKWLVHRRLRPEAFGGLVHLGLGGRYPGLLHANILDSPALKRVHSRHGSYLLPMAFPEGSPQHPSYSAGHATVGGACVTILKALFDESYVIPNPVVPTADGLDLAAYEGAELTVGGELNKLASNVATGRNIAGVHWRSDALESMRLGEEVAIQLLRDHKGCFNERFAGFTFTRFDGSTVTV